MMPDPAQGRGAHPGMPAAPGYGAPPVGAPPVGAPPMHAVPPVPPVLAAAPGDRRGELQGGNRTVYEFTGAAAARESASKGTFMGATLDLSHHKEVRESNLRSGASTWIFLAFAVVAGVGVTAYFVTGGRGASAEQDKDEAVVADDGKAEETKAEDAKAEDAKAEDAKAEDAKAEDAKAEDAKAEDTKAEDPKAEDPKADAPKDEPKAEPAAPAEDPPKPAPKPSSSGTTTKKTTTTKKPSTTTTPKPTTEPTNTGGKTLSPKKPPRDPLKGLPKPP